MKEREKKNNLVSRAEAVARQPQCVGLDVVYDLALPPITSLFMTYKYVWFFLSSSSLPSLYFTTHWN